MLAFTQPLLASELQKCLVVHEAPDIEPLAQLFQRWQAHSGTINLYLSLGLSTLTCFVYLVCGHSMLSSLSDIERGKVVWTRHWALG